MRSVPPGSSSSTTPIDVVAVAQGVARFLAVESCGQCTPCKQDGLAIAALLEQFCASNATDDDLAQLAARVDTVADEARCFLAHQQQRVIGSLLALFPDALAVHMEASPERAEAVTPVLIAPLTSRRWRCRHRRRGPPHQATRLDPRSRRLGRGARRPPDLTNSFGARSSRLRSGVRARSFGSRGSRFRRQLALAVFDRNRPVACRCRRCCRRRVGAYHALVTALSVRALLFTDIEGSTGLVRGLGDRFEGVLERHHTIIRSAVADGGGVEQSREGDSLFITFRSATAALEGAAEAQLRD